MHRLGGGVGRERDAERVQRLVVAPHADPAAHQIERREAEQPDQHARAGPEQEQVEAEPRPARVAAGALRSRNASETSTIGSSTTSLSPLSIRSAWRARGRQLGTPQQAPQQHRIGRRERRAEDRGAGAERPSSHQAAAANNAAESSVPGPIASSASPRWARASRRSSESASVNSISASDSVAAIWSAGESSSTRVPRGRRGRAPRPEPGRSPPAARRSLDETREQRGDQDHGADQRERAASSAGDRIGTAGSILPAAPAAGFSA